MPAYRITKPLPDELIYRAGERYLFHRFTGYNQWSLALRKAEPVPYRAVLLCRRATEAALDNALATGFEVSDASAAERIMETLCRLGYAERVVLLPG